MAYPTRHHRVVTWLLAVLLIGGSTSPSAYAHSHGGGEASHTLRSQQALRPAELQQKHLHSHPHCHTTRPGDASEAPAAHSHVAVLWFELTFPASRRGESAPSESERDDLLAFTFMRVIDQYLPNADDETNTSSNGVKLSLVQSTAAVLSIHSLRHEQPTAADVLLCDTARLECSGVRRC